MRRKLPPARTHGVQQQPVSTIEWVPRDKLFSNSYNPNHVAPFELHLLKISIIEDGWTQPIVARRSGEIVDGWHRFLVSAEPEIIAMTDGMVPVVFLAEIPTEHQIMSTIRHNRARGTHGILPMAQIVRRLIDEEKISLEEIMQRLQMDEEEIDRLYDRAGIRGKAAKSEFTKGWTPG
jgi:ParB-like chromosome segregation protein Spo0J